MDTIRVDSQDDAVHTRGGRFAKELSFWLERNPDQRTLWTPTMTLSDEFFATIQHHRVPIDTHHLARLARSPRRMDLYVWLSYRTPRIPTRRREPISLRAPPSTAAGRISFFGKLRNPDGASRHCLSRYVTRSGAVLRGSALGSVR